MPIYVFSDGTNAGLAKLLRLPRSRRITFGSSIADLFALSRANVMIASASPFSMWASYLGRMAVVWRLVPQRPCYGNLTAGVECGFDDEIPDSFFRDVSHSQDGI